MMRISKVNYKIQFGKSNVQLFMDTGDHVSIKYVTSIEIPITKIRRSHDCLIFTMEIIILVKTVFILRRALIALCIHRDTICSTEHCSQ